MCKYYRGKIKPSKGSGRAGKGDVALYCMIRKGLSEKVTFEK